MAESLLDQALGYARARLDFVDEGVTKTRLRARLDVLDGASRAIALEDVSTASVVTLVRMALELRDEIHAHETSA